MYICKKKKTTCLQKKYAVVGNERPVNYWQVMDAHVVDHASLKWILK
jgi:hypothetical protein